MVTEILNQEMDDVTHAIDMPAPTLWPIVLAFGLTLLFASLLTSEAVGVLGAVVAIAGAVGWFRDVLPQERHEPVPVRPAAPRVSSSRNEVDQMAVAPGSRRAWLPVETYPVSAGIKGSIAGGIAMALLAMLYGVLSGMGVWYPINLLAAGFFPASSMDTTGEIAAFHSSALLIAIAIHLVTSLLVGLLYGAMLPMLPRRPILLGGILAPLLWSGLLHSILDTVNPVLNARIDWRWFVLSQIGFGLVAGFVVSRQGRVRTGQQIPLAIRLGLEISGMDKSGSEGGSR